MDLLILSFDQIFKISLSNRFDTSQQTFAFLLGVVVFQTLERIRVGFFDHFQPHVIVGQVFISRIQFVNILRGVFRFRFAELNIGRCGVFTFVQFIVQPIFEKLSVNLHGHFKPKQLTYLAILIKAVPSKSPIECDFQ